MDSLYGTLTIFVRIPFKWQGHTKVKTRTVHTEFLVTYAQARALVADFRGENHADGVEYLAEWKAQASL